MKKLFVGTVLASAVACYGVPTTANAASVATGDFEVPILAPGQFMTFDTGSTIQGWTVVGNVFGNVALISGPLTLTNSAGAFILNAQSGFQFLDLAGTSTFFGEGVSQSVATTAGHDYLLSFWVGNVSDPSGQLGTTSTVNVQVNGSTIFSAENSITPNTFFCPPPVNFCQDLAWKNFTTTFVASSSSTALAFLSGDPSTDHFNGLDNITIADLGAVPLPAALPLFATGLGALGLLGWRRKRKALGTA